MSVKFVNETSDAAWDAHVNTLTAQFALLNWLGCVNPMQAYDDNLAEVRPLSQIAINHEVTGTNVAQTWSEDATVLNDGTYKDTISINPVHAWASYADFMDTVVHEILHGTARINKVGSDLINPLVFGPIH